jgi:uncharacterized protein with HEPN domain
LSRDWRLYLKDMRGAAGKVVRYSEGFDMLTFASNELARDAVLRNLEIIGEAAKHIPTEIRDKAPKLEWRRVTGLRDIVAHAYFGIDNAILWDIVSVKVPELIETLQGLDESN